MSKASRILELIQLIQRKNSFTVNELAQELGVSYRTMLRYLDELSANGVPLYSVPGKNGGYRVLTIDSNGAYTQQKVQFPSTISRDMVIRPSFMIVGKAIRAPYPALRFIQSIIQIIKEELESNLEVIKYKLKNGRMVGLMRREGYQFTFFVGTEVYSARNIPEGMEAITVPVQQYAVYVHEGDWSRVDIEETLSYSREMLQSKELVIDLEAYILVLPNDTRQQSTVYIPVKTPYN